MNTPLSLSEPALRPKRVQEIMDAAESTVAEWLASGELQHYRNGRFIRVMPDWLREFILRRVVRAKEHGRLVQPLTPAQLELFWDWLRPQVQTEIRRLSQEVTEKTELRAARAQEVAA